MRSAASLARGTLAALALMLVVVPAAASAAGPRLDRGERAIVNAVNHVRAQHGLSHLGASRSLSRAADRHTASMLRDDYFAHGAIGARLHARAIGETLAMLSPRCGGGAAREIVSLWMHSPPHRAVLLSGEYRRIGIGRRTGRLGSTQACMVTADFASAR